MPSTTAESGTVAVVTLNQSLVLTALCLDFYDCGHGCSKVITVNDYKSFCISEYLCVFGAYTIKNTKVGIAVQVWLYPGNRMWPHGII